MSIFFCGFFGFGALNFEIKAVQGNFDPVFGAGGTVIISDFRPDPAAGSSAAAVAVQPDGKIAAAGYSRQGSTRDFALARYNANGSPDNSFSGDGKLITTFNSGQGDEAFSLFYSQTENSSPPVMPLR